MGTQTSQGVKGQADNSLVGTQTGHRKVPEIMKGKREEREEEEQEKKDFFTEAKTSTRR